MSRPFDNHERMSHAFELHCRGLGQKEIIGILSEYYKAPSPRTLNYWIKRFKAVGPEELKLEQSIQWNLMGEYGIPWESTSLLIGLSNRGFPTIRRAQWWWRVSLARPDFSYSEILKIADLCVLYQHIEILEIGVPDWDMVWNQLKVNDHKSDFGESIPGRYALCKFSADETLPDWVNVSGFVSITRSGQMLTVICSEDEIPDEGQEGVIIQRGWELSRYRRDHLNLRSSDRTLIVSTADGDYVLVS